METDGPALTVWREFVDRLRSGGLQADKLNPYLPELGMALQVTAKAVMDNVVAGWDSEPECFRNGSDLVFLILLVFADGSPRQFSFTFSTDNGEWRLRHVESIVIPLDRLPPLPVSDFPDLPADQKEWVRQELALTEQVRLFRYLRREQGRDFALRWFCDGAGYALAARAWVPFVSPARAFVLYLCWEQARLQGSKVTLERLSDTDAVVMLTPMYFCIYNQATHLRQQISFEDLTSLFETVWHDRASHAGWTLVIQHVGDECVLQLTRAEMVNPG